jgi:hypothetical protein
MEAHWLTTRSVRLQRGADLVRIAELSISPVSLRHRLDIAVGDPFDRATQDIA